MTCAEAAALESARLDGRLGPADRIAAAVHRRRCPPCRRFAAQLHWLRRQLRRWSAPRLSSERRARMRAALAAASGRH